MSLRLLGVSHLLLTLNAFAAAQFGWLRFDRFRIRQIEPSLCDIICRETSPMIISAEHDLRGNVLSVLLNPIRRHYQLAVFGEMQYLFQSPYLQDCSKPKGA